ncbi:MAG: iron-sulfur cluster-binding protein [Gammaproteobacteria bacterium]|nr:iron-sulfur cluster-binding protein [Gammaproteobacteria bacterium]
MKSQAMHFVPNARAAIKDQNLQKALGHIAEGFVGKRAKAVGVIENWQAIREQAAIVKNHTLEHLDHYLAQYEAAVTARGGVVHYADDAEEACRIIDQICKDVGAKSVTKGKSMVSEEVGLNAHLEKSGLDVIETDLGEYILQLAGEMPSHIIAPAIHKTKEQVSELFAEHHQRPKLTERTELVTEARQILREKFLGADVGITGANFLVAETGQHVLVTNEGNGDLTSCLPKTQVVITGIEKVVPTLEDAGLMLTLLARSATGQAFSNYTSFYGGPRQADEGQGPDAFHVVLVDNGRTRMLGNDFREMLRCIRCGACLNHCPVYSSIGGHAYGWVYPGPMGSVVTPNFIGIDEAGHLPNACTLNGRCGEVCPMSIPLPAMLRKLRDKQAEAKPTPFLMKVWGNLAKRPKLYHAVTKIGIFAARMASFNGRLKVPTPWNNERDMPAPEGKTFQQIYKESRRG